MKIGILGTGMVGNAIGTKLVQLGHEVRMGSRTAGNEKAVKWSETAGSAASHGTFADSAAFGEIVFNCISGSASIDALHLAGVENLKAKILVDLANPLDFSQGMPPFLIPAYSNTTSLGEEIQKEFPETKVVKTLNTMNCNLMVNPSMVAGRHDIFLSGNDADAKAKVNDLLFSFGWKSPIDLGDIKTARGTEMLLPIWITLMGKFRHPNFNFSIVS
jgi:predicted dinucleotide-binding enzyme